MKRPFFRSIWFWTYATAYVVLVVTFWPRFTHQITGDSSVYVNEALRINDDYFSSNFRAIHSGDPAERVVLVTEGGYQFISAFLIRLFGPSAVFWPQRFLLPALILLAARLASLADRSRGGIAWFGVCCCLGFLLLHPELIVLFDLQLRPLRSLFGHLLAITVVAGAFVMNPGSVRQLIGVGFLGGLTAWFNFPGILFLAAPGVRLLLEPGMRLPQRGRRIGMLAGGMLLGLLPLFAQNLFEGKQFYEVGEAAYMLVDEVQVVPEPYRHLPVVFGIHPQNFPHTFPHAARFLWTSAPLAWTVVVVLGLIGSMVLRLRLFLIGLAAALPTMLFYGMYHGHIARYYLSAYLVLVAMSGVGWIAVGNWVFEGRISWPGWKRNTGLLLSLVTLVVVCGSIRVQLSFEYPFQWRDVDHFGSWLDEHFDEDATFLHMSEHLATWTNLSDDGLRRRLPWLWSLAPGLSLAEPSFLPKEYRSAWTALGTNVLDNIRHEVNAGRQVVWMEWEPVREDVRVLHSWWREDLLTHFSFETHAPTLTFGEDYPYRLRARVLQPFKAIQRYLLPPPGEGQKTRLYLQGRYTEGVPLTPAKVVVRAEDVVVLEKPLWPGDQIWNLPPVSNATELSVGIEGQAPELRRLQWLAMSEGVRQDVQAKRVEDAPFFARAFPGAKINWQEHKLWARDVAAYASERASVKFDLLLQEAQQIQVPVAEEPLRYRLLVAGKGMRDGTSMIEQHWSLQLGEVPLAFDTWGGATKESGKGESLHMVSFTLPASEVPRCVTMNLGASSNEDWRLLATYFEPVPEPPPFAASTAHAGRVIGHPAGVAYPGPGKVMEDPNLRYLDAPTHVHLPNGNGFNRLRVYAQKSADPMEVVARSHAGKVIRFPLPEDGGDSMLVFPPDVACKDYDLWVTHGVVVIDKPEGLQLTEGGELPAEIRLTGADAEFFELSGLYRPERDADGGLVRWASDRVSFSVTPLGEVKDDAYVLSLTIRGPVAAVSPRELRIRLQGDLLTELLLPRWEEGWSKVRIPLPAWDPASATGLQFMCEADTWSPTQVDGSGDRRNLSFLLKSISFERY